MEERIKKKAIGETRELTYELFKKGHSIDQISKEREFKIETTQGHILDLIAHGMIDAQDVISKDDFNNILSSINENNVNSLKQIYEDLKEKFSYFKIKCVLASLASKPEKI